MAYLFVFFTEEKLKDGEQVYFAVSRDGLHWNDLRKDGPALVSSVGEEGVRDPYILFNPLDKYYYIIATDLRIAANKGWKCAAAEGSRSIIMWKSQDLVHWQNAIKVELSAMIDISAGCVWAPEAIYDFQNRKFVMFWASSINGMQKMYAADTIDFQKFENYRLFMECDEHIIDTTIISQSRYFYRFSVYYGCIGMDRVTSLSAPAYCEGKITPIEATHGMEGAIMVYLESLQKWCLYADNSSKAEGYIPFVCSDLDSATFERLDSKEYDLGKRLKRHGSIINISEGDYDNLVKYYGMYE